MAAPQSAPARVLTEEEFFPRWLDALAMALLAARWLTPTEGVDRGLTLWIAQLWTLWAALAAWAVFRLEIQWQPRLTRIGFFLTLLIGGHLVSALLVFVTDGQKRAAMNGFWEWTSLGIAALWIAGRRSSPGFHRRFVEVIVASAVALSVYGLWQRSVGHPALSQNVLEFDRLEREIPELTGNMRRLAIERFQSLGEQLGPEYVSLDSNGRQAMRQRLIGSSEPLGLFALANTFAALLTVAVLVGIERLIKRRPRPGFVITAAGLLLVALTLILTKSRTAWVGTLCGAAVGAFILRRESSGRRRLGMAAAIVIGTLGLLGVAAATLEGIDWKVIAESSKSLRYRSEYWRSSWSVVQQHPFFGVGPGNFRQHYLQFKLPESSEEIVDPHDLFLDVWLNGGLLALVGALGACVLLVSAIARHPPPAGPALRDRQGAAFVPSALIVATVLVALHAWLLEGALNVDAALTGTGAALLSLAIRRTGEAGAQWVRASLAAAWVALTVHLLGAGGIEMPAVSELWLWLALAVAGLPVPRNASEAASMPPRKMSAGFTSRLSALVAISALTVAGIQFGWFTAPVLQSQTFLGAAENAMMRGNLQQALHDLETAAAADPLDPESRRRLAQIAMGDWKRTGEADEFDRAVRWETEAMKCDPENPHDKRLMGEMYLHRFERDRRDKDADMAEVWLRRAVAGYPHHAQTQASFARGALASGHIAEALQAAAIALHLDQRNRDLGHYDRLLPDDLIERLQKMLAADAADPPAPDHSD